jgi:broad specificity phosphatase PhoE
LNEIRFGAFDGGPLAAYRSWAWSTGPAEECPGGGESRVDAALRWASALERLLARPEERIVAVTHALPLRYVIDASDGVFPAARMAPVEHATAFAFTAEQIATAAATLRGWAAAPRFTDAEPDA